MPSTRFIIVRHGETEWNIQGIRQGHLDSPLTAKGLAQAQALAARFRPDSYEAVYSSDLGRAYETAKTIARHTGHEVVVDSRLRERNLGIFQGLTSEAIRENYPEEYAIHRNNGPDYVIPSGESFREQVTRNISCLEELAGKHAGESILIVTHGGVLSGLFRYALSIPLEAPRRFIFKNACVNVFNYDQDHWMLETWGDLSHLESTGAIDLSYF